MTAVLPRSLFEVKRGLCPGCGSPLPIDPESASTTCRFCGIEAVLERRLRRKEPEVVGAPLPLFVDVGGAEAGATGSRTPWVRSRQFRGAFVERFVCPGCGEGIDLAGDGAHVLCASCGTESIVERRLWAPPPDPSTEIPRPRHPSERRRENTEDADAETEHLIFRIVNEKDPLEKLALVFTLGENWCYVNKTAVRLLPAILASTKGADPRYQYAACRIVGKLLCEGDPELRNGTVRAAERFLYDTACPRELVLQVGLGSAVCVKPLLDAAEFALRRGDREYAATALLGIDQIFERNYPEHEVMGEILLYRLLYLSGPVLAYALLIAQRQRIGFFYPAETLLRFMDEAAVERPVLLPELDRAFYTGVPDSEGEYRRRKSFYDTLKTNASRSSALRRWLWPPAQGTPELYRQIAAFLVPLLDEPELRPAAEKALFDLVDMPDEVPEAVHELVKGRRDTLPAEMRRAYLRRVPDSKLLDPRAIPSWEGEKEAGLSPELVKARDDWNAGIREAVEARDTYRAGFRDLLEAIRCRRVQIFNGVSDGPEPVPEGP